MIIPSTTPAHQTGWYRLTAMTLGMPRPFVSAWSQSGAERRQVDLGLEASG